MNDERFQKVHTTKVAINGHSWMLPQSNNLGTLTRIGGVTETVQGKVLFLHVEQ